jgi:hypothetical protein
MLSSRPAGSIHPTASVGAVFSSLPAGATPAAHTGARPASSGDGKPSRGLLFTPLLRHRSVPSLLRPVCPVPCLTKPRFFTNSPVLAGRFFGMDDELQKPSCSFVQTPEEGILFLERRSANRQLYDISCANRDPRFVYRIGTALICSFKNTWLDAAGRNVQPVLESCERYLACGNVAFGGNVARGRGCGQPTPGMNPPTNPPVVQCSTTQVAGSNTPETHQVELAKTSGTFRFDFDT